MVVDLSVPRNVDPRRRLDGVELLDMDDLRAAVADALDGRRARWPRPAHRRPTRSSATGPTSGPGGRRRSCRPCGAGWRRCAGPSSTVTGPRSDLDEDQWEEVDAVTRAILAKLLHQPTVALKEAAGTPRGERLVEALRSLFDL